jgi:hypothetical protein
MVVETLLVVPVLKELFGIGLEEEVTPLPALESEEADSR